MDKQNKTVRDLVFDLDESFGEFMGHRKTIEAITVEIAHIRDDKIIWI